MDESRKIYVGRIVGTHGVRGAVKVKTYTQTPLSILDYDPLQTAQGQELPLHLLHTKNDILIARIEGIDTLEAAAALKDTDLFIDRASLPEMSDDDEYYISDLEGLDVRVDNEVVGSVEKVLPMGGGYLLQVRAVGQKKGWDIPFRKEFVPQVNLAENYLSLDPDYYQSLKNL